MEEKKDGAESKGPAPEAKPASAPAKPAPARSSVRNVESDGADEAKPDTTTQLMAEMLKTMQAMQAAGRKEPAQPNHDLFEAKEGYYVVNSQGQKVRHGEKPFGLPTYLDEDGNPVDENE